MKKYLFPIIFGTCCYFPSLSQEYREIAVDKPQAVADLRQKNGASLLSAQWYVQPARLVETTFKAPGPIAQDTNLIYPTGAKIKTHLLKPQVGDPNFESGFESISPEKLESRQGNGLVSAVWYKLTLTVPTQVGSLQVNGKTLVFEVVMDDYSEIWLNGKQTKVLGQVGNGLISGYNAPNRIILTQNARPGEIFNLYILGINGPLGMIPDNYIWIRNAVIDFYNEIPVYQSWKEAGQVYPFDETLDRVIAPGTQPEKLAEGFQFTEGPVWHPDGYLLFSDPNTNNIYRYSPQNHNVSIYMSHSGYTGVDIGEYGQPGSNGLAIDKQGRLLIDQHGNRRVIRIEKKGTLKVLADNFERHRLNSPNDIVQKSDGTIYFTDPPYGLPNNFKDKRKELDFSGIYMINNDKLTCLSKDLGGPNGLAFSPDEKYFYVTNWDIRDIHHTKTLWRYEVTPEGTLKNGKIFYDFNFTEGEEALDGMKVDKMGNLFISAPGGIWVLSSQGKLLGKIVTPERPSNLAWGDEDGKSLYLTARTGLYKIRVLTGGKFSWE